MRNSLPVVEVEISVDCVATFDEDAHAGALRHMETILGTKLVHRAVPTAG